MGKITGFKEYARQAEAYRDPAVRLLDFQEIFPPHNETQLHTQAARCMDCGVPFCQSNEGCPVYNLIPEWNDLVYQGRWQDALARLHKTNNFPEFTGRVCPAPCEGACVLRITDPPVTIKNIECAIIDKGFDEGWVQADAPSHRTDKKIAIVGSGPCGLAAASQLNSAGHNVSVYERADRIGGLLMYGIPNMKLDKAIVDRRVQLMRDAGINFIPNTQVGKDLAVAALVAEHDALLLAIGAEVARDLPAPGRDAQGIHLAMDFLTLHTKSLLDSQLEDGRYISAKDKDVIVIGGGDTGTDCIATALRHGCRSLVNFELLPQPPAEPGPDNPWPLWPRIHRVEYGHAEAAQMFGNDPRVFSLMTQTFIKDANNQLTGLTSLNVDAKLQAIPGSEQHWQADLVLLAMGFLHPAHALSDALGIETDDRGNFKATKETYRTNVPKVYAAAECRRGQDLVVRAINEGREAAREIDRHLMGSTHLL